MRRLERSLGVTLFVRTNRRLQLTEAGRVLLPQARRTLADALVGADVFLGLSAAGALKDEGIRAYVEGNGRFQLSGTLNPDFGQVESDQLVVNFGAVETFFSDKRPFFTENQGIFDFGTPSDFSQLLYTRRVGGRQLAAGVAAIGVHGGFLGRFGGPVHQSPEACEVKRVAEARPQNGRTTLPL